MKSADNLLSLPEVAVNFALTWDGRVSTRNRTRADFSSSRDKHRLVEIRASGDALLVGRATQEIEQMRMKIGDPALQAARVARGLPPEPLRVVVSGSGLIDPESPLFHTEGSPIVIFSTTKMPEIARAALQGKAALHLSDGPLDLRAVLQTLRSDYNVQRVVCEGGPTLLRSLLEKNLVDEINVTFCPRIFGGEDAPSLTGGPGAFLPAAVACRLEAMETVGDECFARYRVINPPCAVTLPA
ncbi:MAG: dihydrofolate reductase family protein [Verrucomicrobiota bacterium]